MRSEKPSHLAEIITGVKYGIKLGGQTLHAVATLNNPHNRTDPNLTKSIDSYFGASCLASWWLTLGIQVTGYTPAFYAGHEEAILLIPATNLYYYIHHYYKRAGE